MNQPDERPPAAGTQPIYLIPQSEFTRSSQDEVSLAELWATLWQGRWLFCLIIGIFAACGLGYAFLATSWYQAEVLLAPVKEQKAEDLAGVLGGLAGIAGLAGIKVGGGDTAESIAVLRSRELTGAFIAEQNLMPLFYPDDWNNEAGQWKSADREDWPDLRQGVRYFDEELRDVSEDRATGLVTLSVEWTDAELAARWANMLVQRVNTTMRQRALADAERNVAYLQRELAGTTVVTLQQSIGHLLETEMQKVMLARGNEEFAFRVIDRAEPPKLRSWPRRALIVVLSIILGGILAVFVVMVRHGNIQRRDAGGVLPQHNSQ